MGVRKIIHGNQGLVPGQVRVGINAELSTVLRLKRIYDSAGRETWIASARLSKDERISLGYYPQKSPNGIFEYENERLGLKVSRSFNFNAEGPTDKFFIIDLPKFSVGPSRPELRVSIHTPGVC